jgi:hypothetical protein
MPFYEIKFVPNNGTTRGKYRFYDVVYSDGNKKCDDVKKEYQDLLKTQNVKVMKRTSM